MADLQDTEKTQFTVVSLPIDIISNILTRLPVEDVIRFKTVSKELYHLISSLHFSHLHFTSHSSHFQDRIVVFVGKGDGCLYFSSLDISDSFNPKKVNINGFYFDDIVGSCNGLLLCICNRNDDNILSLVVVNPTTLQLKLISNSSTNKGLFGYGFGYVSENDDYKVVRIVRGSIHEDHDVPTKWQIGVYSLKFDSWKFFDQLFSTGIILCRDGVLINNHMLHWLFYVFHGRVIRSFDLCTGKWSEVSLPAFIENATPAHINVFDERLCLLIFDHRSVFVMDVYGVRDSWVERFDWPYQKYPCPLFYYKSRSEILVFVGSRLYWYNSTQKTCREIQSHNVFHPSAQLIMCTRSLVRLPSCG